MTRTLLAATLLALGLAQPALALEGTLDRSHTQAEFVVLHMQLDKVHGQIPLQSGTATLGPDNLPTALTAVFDGAAVTSQNDRRDQDLRDNYFEVAQFPTITFVERSIKGTPDAFSLTGDLTIHGVTKSVVLAGKIDGVATINGKKHVAFTGTTTIDRRDYGMTLVKFIDNQLFVGYPVTINFEAGVAER
jgi:polyisoprenoid-binding protein YceI